MLSGAEAAFARVLARRAVVTAANVHDQHPLPKLLHGQRAARLRPQRYALPNG